jgi:hypothetical protein
MGIATFSGKPGKLKFKGDFGFGQYNVGDDYYESDPYVAKMISTDPGFITGATLARQGGKQTAFVPGEEKSRWRLLPL